MRFADFILKFFLNGFQGVWKLIGYKNGGSVLFFGDEQLIRKSYVDFILILKKWCKKFASLIMSPLFWNNLFFFRQLLYSLLTISKLMVFVVRKYGHFIFFEVLISFIWKPLDSNPAVLYTALTLCSVHCHRICLMDFTKQKMRLSPLKGPFTYLGNFRVN